MVKKRSTLEQMRSAPQKDWKINDVERVCGHYGVDIRKPNGGSHYVVYSAHLRDALTIPFKRPIKTIYIKTLVGYIDAHVSRKGADDE